MFTNLSNIKKIICNAPNEPGVYIFFNTKNEAIYIGKAIKLKTRLKFYIDKNVLSKYPKTLKMVQSAYEVKYFIVDTEVEALVLEANLIKKYNPKYNINLKDGKSYKYIEVVKDKTNTYKVSSVRKKTPLGKYFGPYPSGADVYYVLKNLRKIFPYRDCSLVKFNYYKKLERPCLYGNIGLCAVPCQGDKNTPLNTRNINMLKKFLNGNAKKVINDLAKQMYLLSSEKNFEEAQIIKKRLLHYEHLSKKYKNEVELLRGVGDIGSESYKVKELVEILSNYFDIYKNYLNNQDYLNNFRIEYFDISNLGSDIIVGASTCSIGGTLNKDYYRKYKIKNSLGNGPQLYQNDFQAISQIVLRRLKNNIKWGSPHLIVLDGGRGQLSAVLKQTVGFKIPIIALAKKNEEIFLVFEGVYKKIILPKNSYSLSILIKGRNEVHRFGVTYNRSLRAITR